MTGMVAIPDLWENFELRAFADVYYRVKAEGEQRTGALRMDRRTLCMDRRDAYACLRAAGHPGRHVAPGDGLLAAAWPGELPPTLADLEA